jgi:KaiC/GvpD/RAD55 family RecA-like ATPase
MGFGIADSVRLLIEPASLTEVRVLLHSAEERICRNQYYFGHQAEQLARDVHALDQRPDCIGIYLIPNPIDTHLVGNNTKWRKPFITKVVSSNQTNMLRRKWILVDCDSIRPGECSATDAERTAAFELADNVIATLSMLGFGNPIKADSGNGCHLVYPVDLPPDQPSSMLVKEFLSQLGSRCRVMGAKVDPVTWDSQRMVRLYGTKSRKGESTAERPWRLSGILDPGTPNSAKNNTYALTVALEAWREQDSLIQGEGRRDPVDAAKRYVAKVDGAVSGAGGHNKTYRVASLLVEGFGLNQKDAFNVILDWNKKCKPEWTEKDLLHKIESAHAKIDQSKLGHLLVKPNPQTIGKVAPAGIQKADATVADLIRLGQSLQWLWKGWIQRGVLVGIAAEPGAGKTRLCADIAKRVHHAMPWPDGSPATLDKGSKVMWLACDGQWGEITQFPEQFGIPADSIYLNAWNLDPTEGTSLDEQKHFKELEDRINRTGVSLVFVDTVMNSTSHNTTRPEEGVKYFKPLADVAQKTNTTIILVTHLSAGGEALGRRIVGQCRQMISLAKIDGEPHNSKQRKVWVSKSNSVMPNELTVTMGDNGNEYRTDGEQQPTIGPSKINENEWLAIYLKSGKKPLELLLSDAAMHGLDAEIIKKLIPLIANQSDVGSYNWIKLVKRE